MAAPVEPPESVVVGNFRGIKNTVSRERLAVDELMARLGGQQRQEIVVAGQPRLIVRDSTAPPPV